MRYILLLFLLMGIGSVVVLGTRGHTFRKPPVYIFPDMDRQPKLRPQEPNRFFASGISSQLPVPGTIARGDPYEDTPVNTGKKPGTTNYVDTIPIPVTAELMARGQERFNIYCAACHGQAGDGKGTPTKFGMAVIADLHDSKARKVPQQSDGEIFYTITYGKNLMQPYGPQIPINDRWAIIAYLRALQRSRLATLEDVPAELRAELSRALPATPSAAASTNQAPAGAQPASAQPK